METSAVGARGVEPGVVLRPPPDLPCPQRSWRRRNKWCPSGRFVISSGHVPPWSGAAMRRRSWPILQRRRVCLCTPTPGGAGAAAGLTAPAGWQTRQDGAHRPGLPPLEHAVVNAIAGEVVAEPARPLSRPARGELTVRAGRTRSRPIRRRTVWRLRPAAALNPWR
jgi:hypothetical protein